MKNDYILTLTGAQNWDGDTDTTEMRTDCSLSAEDGGYVIRYEEIAPFGNDCRYREILRGHGRSRNEDFETVVFRKDGRDFTAAICRGSGQAEKALSEIGSFDVIRILSL